jgi:hypothetical protein
MNHVFGFDPLILIILWAVQIVIAAAMYFDAKKRGLNAVFWSGAGTG